MPLVSYSSYYYSYCYDLDELIVEILKLPNAFLFFFCKVCYSVLCVYIRPFRDVLFECIHTDTCKSLYYYLYRFPLLSNISHCYQLFFFAFM